MKDALGAVQSVLVLGGTSEIGVATARALVRGRARTVVLAARDPEACAEVASTLEADGAERVATVPFDAVDFPSHAAFVDRLFDEVGDIDLALVAFGVLGEEDDPVEVVNVNFAGAASVMTPLARRMSEQGHGTIVLLSSVAGERARKSNYMYGSSKAGIDAFAQGLGDSLAGSGVSVMIVRPGFVKTKMTAHLDPVPFSTTPEAVADEVVRGLARGSQTVWVPGVLRGVMSVLRHVPRRLFRRLPL
ncbi:MAG: decaprenylphospho-beta-D-erythro-pentofuranosid-2-ulose 2-reductase [Thermoleophilaceae bacterium]|nr:decaprenylphospho-beta-D-erythro-pentofuranosid-2-ulose 2-reductase [Thermoleophilaceae bacterium]